MRAKIKLGPIMQQAVRDAMELMVDDACCDEYPSTFDWILHEICPEAVPADTGQVALLLSDTPGLLGYPVVLDDLYPMELVTPGWFIGEAAYRLVAEIVSTHIDNQLATVVTPLRAGEPGSERR